MTKFGRSKNHQAHLSQGTGDRFFRKINKDLPSASGPPVMSDCSRALPPKEREMLELKFLLFGFKNYIMSFLYIN